MLKVKSFLIVTILVVAALVPGCGKGVEEPAPEGKSAKAYVDTVLAQIPADGHIYEIGGGDILVNGNIMWDQMWEFSTLSSDGRSRILCYGNGKVDKWGGGGVSPWEDMNILDNWNIDSPTAIATADANGGKELRDSIFRLSVVMFLYPSYEGYSDPMWKIEYSKPTGELLKTYLINAKTGALEATK